jgi:hypothetical protein
MTRLLREAAFAAVLTVAAPVWAQVPMTAEDLNRQELNRLAQAPQAGRTAPANVVINDTVGVNAAALAAGKRPPSPPLPGLLTLLGVGVAAGLSVVDTVVVGGPIR